MTEWYLTSLISITTNITLLAAITFFYARHETKKLQDEMNQTDTPPKQFFFA